MKKHIYVVIMAGGIGSRFWPVSREKKPKQFLDILNIGKSLLTLTYERFSGICDKENFLIVTNERYRDLVQQQLPDLTHDQILGEPVGKNTAPCIAYATYKILKKDPNAICIVAPSDHAIFNEQRFLEMVSMAINEAATSDKLITLGIKPHKPETGYGYIQFLDHENELKKVKTFTEKPELDLAKKFVESGDFLWNAGIFVWSASTIKNAFEEYLPEIAEVFNEVTPYYYTTEEQAHIELAYSQFKPISVDYAIMEKSPNVFVYPGDFGWSDLGSWSSLHEFGKKDETNNYVDGNALLFDVKDSVIKGSKKQLIVASNLKGYLIAVEGNAILICKKDKERTFRKIFAEVKKKKGNEFL